MNKPRLLVPCSFAALSVHPSLTLGNPSGSSAALGVCHLDNRLSTQISSAKTYESLQVKDVWGMFRLQRGDFYPQNSALIRTHASYRPDYYRNYVPTQIIMRGVRID